MADEEEETENLADAEEEAAVEPAGSEEEVVETEEVEEEEAGDKAAKKETKKKEEKKEQKKAKKQVEEEEEEEEDADTRERKRSTDAAGFLDPSSVFGDEKKFATIWIGFIASYWTLLIIIPILIKMSFNSEILGLIIYCIGMVAVVGGLISFRGGQLPSGAVEQRADGEEETYDGKGRWAALAVITAICVDFLAIGFVSLSQKTGMAQYFRGSLHWIALVYGSLFYYRRFYANNPTIARYAFWMEWGDIIFTVVVIFFLYHSVGDNKNCFDEPACVVYYVFLCVQLFGWLLPMVIIRSWGASKNATTVSMHLFFLDMFTDTPVIITNIASYAFKAHAIVFVDTVLKTFGVIRSASYYMVWYVWLNKGIVGGIKDLAAKANKKKEEDALR